MLRYIVSVSACLLLAMTVSALAADNRSAATSEKDAGADFAFQGEYSGMIKAGDGELKLGVQVIALGEGKFRAVAYPGGLPGDGWNREHGKHAADGVVLGLHRFDESNHVLGARGVGAAHGIVLDAALIESRQVVLAFFYERVTDCWGCAE